MTVFFEDFRSCFSSQKKEGGAGRSCLLDSNRSSPLLAQKRPGSELSGRWRGGGWRELSGPAAG